MADTNPSAQFDTIIASASGIVSVAESLQASLAAVTNPDTGLKADAESLLSKLIGLQRSPPTMTPEQQADLDQAVTLATSLFNALQ